MSIWFVLHCLFGSYFIFWSPSSWSRENCCYHILALSFISQRYTWIPWPNGLLLMFCQRIRSIVFTFHGLVEERFFRLVWFGFCCFFKTQEGPDLHSCFILAWLLQSLHSGDSCIGYRDWHSAISKRSSHCLLQPEIIFKNAGCLDL